MSKIRTKHNVVTCLKYSTLQFCLCVHCAVFCELGSPTDLILSLKVVAGQPDFRMTKCCVIVYINCRDRQELNQVQDIRDPLLDFKYEMLIHFLKFRSGAGVR